MSGNTITREACCSVSEWWMVTESSVAKAIHSMIRVADEARSVAFYKTAFGLDVADRFDFDGFTLIYLRNGEADFELELTVNNETTEPYEHGSGYGHLAFAVDDLDAEYSHMKSSGLEPNDIVAFERDGSLMARFFFIQDPDGYKLEVLQRHGRYL